MLTADEEKVLEIGFGAAMEPINRRLDDLLGPASKTIGCLLNAMLCTQMRNVVKIYNGAAQMLAKAGISIAPVPLKLMKPILDGASMEEDEEIQTLWSALLANASIDDAENEVSPSFPEVLRQLSSRDARILKSLFDLAKTKEAPTRYLGSHAELAAQLPEYTWTQVLDSLESLIHHTILESETLERRHGEGSFVTETKERVFRITTYGGRFLWACEPPKAK